MLGSVLTCLDHVVVAVTDLETATDHYARLLGRSPSWRGSSSLADTSNAIFRTANVALHLISPAQDGPIASAVGKWLEKRGEGLYSLTFACDDAEGAVHWLRQRGLEAIDPIDGEGTGDGDYGMRSWRLVVLPPSSTRRIALSLSQDTSDPAVVPPAALGVDSAAAVEGLDHVVISSPDPEATRLLYGQALGLHLALDRTFDERGLRILFFCLAGVTVEVVGSLTDPVRPEAGDRFGGLAWQVNDVAAIRERLARQGFDVSEDRAGHKPGTRVCTVRSDTHGVPTLLIGPDG
ncbi:MAG: VOC family protein [Proteobacteria bacterium]|nr:VOC family protein [Pseudomonadota bacterium]